MLMIGIPVLIVIVVINIVMVGGFTKGHMLLVQTFYNKDGLSSLSLCSGQILGELKGMMTILEQCCGSIAEVYPIISAPLLKKSFLFSFFSCSFVLRWYDFIVFVLVSCCIY